MTTTARRREPDDLARLFCGIAVRAGLRILTGAEGVRARDKADGSPVTALDEEAQEIIVEELGRSLPGVLIVAEEGDARPVRGADESAFILVDPLDGTRDFLNGSPEWTVNIALVDGDRVVAGAMHAPALGRLFAGGRSAIEVAVEPGQAFGDELPRRPMRCRADRATPVALESRSHPDPVTERLTVALGRTERRQVSSSLKFALIAAGEADLHVRAAPLTEWDVAAGDAVLTAAGGAVLAFDGEPLRYGSAGYRVPPYLAVADPNAGRAIVRRIGGVLEPSPAAAAR
jgi:3'(2'), 5'-bisphosphate nucleotidase